MVLLLMSLLTIMVVALFQSVRNEFYLTSNHRDQVQALYLAEAGLVDSLTQLELDPAWTDGFQEKQLPGMPGSYSVEFNTSGSGFTNRESVNNSDGTQPDNYRGADQIPAGYCSVIVVARVGTAQRVLEGLIQVGGGLYPTDFPLLSSGRIRWGGQVGIDGIKSLTDSQPIQGDVHSNYGGTDPDLIIFNGTPGDIQITGKVSSVGTNPSAINLNGYTPGDGVENGAASKPIQNVNILARISQKSSAPAPSINTNGTSTLNSGDLYHSGDLVINGDLELNGAKLYVNGKLTVNGSITGDGSIYVAGATSFHGDARVTATSPDKIALYSEGSVSLSGFDGSAYMESLASSDPSVGTLWNQLQRSMGDLEARLANPDRYTLGDDGRVDAIIQEIGGVPSGSAPAPRAGRQADAAGKLHRILDSQPDSTAKRALQSKFQYLHELFFSYADFSPEEYAATSAFLADRLVKGSFDVYTDWSLSSYTPFMLNVTRSIDYHSLGTSYFQGLVYTHGAIHADSEVNILGAVVAHDTGSQGPVTIDGQDLEPGDVFLDQGTQVTYVEDFFHPRNPSGGSGGAGAQIKLWMNR